jgi:hypothetical protein
MEGQAIGHADGCKRPGVMVMGQVVPEREWACSCHACRDERETPMERLCRVMVTCSTCGNKRCPHATDHRNACTGSNEPGQPGSIYR